MFIPYSVALVYTTQWGVQRHPRRRKMRHRNPQGDKNKEVRGTKFKIVATRCHILRLKFDFGWGSAPDPAGGAHSALPDPLAGFEGVLLLREGKGMGGKGMGEKGRERKGRGKVASWLWRDGRPWQHDYRYEIN